MLLLCITHRSVYQSLIQELLKFMAVKLFSVSTNDSDNTIFVKITALPRGLYDTPVYTSTGAITFFLRNAADMCYIFTPFIYLTQEFCLHICSNSSRYFRIILFPCSLVPLFTALVLLLMSVV